MGRSLVRRSLLALILAAYFSDVATAQSGSWIVDASGNWTDTANWSGGIAANGFGNTATFANDITADRTVTLNSARTVSNLIFGDADTSTAGGWTIAGPNTLTLTNSTTPTITVNALGVGKSVEIASAFSANGGLTKAGPGLLKLSGSLSGLGLNVTVNAGTLQFANDNATVTGSARSFAGSGTVILTGSNTGAPTGSVSNYFLSGTNTSFSGTIVADNARLQIDNTSQVGTATLTNSGNGQFSFNFSGTYSNKFVIQGLGWGSDDGNTGAIRLTNGSATTLSGQITLAADARVTNPGTSSVYSILSGPIGESGGARTLEIGGAIRGSSISLSGANTYTGGTIINGTYDVTGFPMVTTLRLDFSTQNNSKLGNSGILRFKGLSSLVLSGGSHAEVVGSTTLDSGANALISGGPSTLNLGALTRNPGATLTISSTVSATSGTAGEAFGTWFVIGNELATKNASNQIIPVTYTDVPTGTGTIVNGPAASVRVTASAGTVALGGTAGDTLTINTLSRHVGGTATLNIAGKTLRIRNGIFSTNGSGGLTIGTTVDSGTLTAGSANDTAGTLDIANGVSGTLLINSKITDNGTGAVTLTRTSATGFGMVFTLQGTNTYSGGTILNAPGGVSLGNSSALGTGPVTLMYSATIEPAAANTPPLTLGNNFAINNGSTLTFSSASSKFTLNGVLSGAAGRLYVSGDSVSNSVTLNNTNTYTGTTTVDSGKLIVNGSITSATTVSTGGTLAGSGTIAGTLSNTGIVAPGNSIGTLTVVGDATFNAGSTYTAELGAANSSDLLNLTSVGSNLSLSSLTDTLNLQSTLDPGTFTIIDYNGSRAGGIFDLVSFNNVAQGAPTVTLGAVNPTGFTGTGDLYNYGAFSVFYNDSNTSVQVGITAIPEPSTMVLGGLALLGFAGVGLRRRRAAM